MVFNLIHLKSCWFFTMSCLCFQPVDRLPTHVAMTLCVGLFLEELMQWRLLLSKPEQMIA